MAQVIPIQYDLSNNGSRRQGQTRESNLLSLHGHRFNSRNAKAENVGTLEEREDDIDALPQDSSEEREAPLFEAEGYGASSDDSEFNDVRGRKPRASQWNPTSSVESTRTKRPSDVYPSKWDASQESLLCLNSGKRKEEPLSDNDAIVNMSFQVSQPKKHRKSAGYGKTKAGPRNIHEPPPPRGKKEYKGNERSLAGRGGNSDFIRPPTKDLLAKCKS